MSAKPIGDVEQFSVRAVNSKIGSAIDDSWSDDLGALSERLLSQSRDLNLDFVGNDGYALATQQGVENVKAFRFILKHRQ